MGAAPTLPYTLHILLSLPAELRLRRLLEREQALYGDRIHPGGDMETDHRAFMAWTAGYDSSTAEGTNTLACHEALLRRAACPVLRLTGPMSKEEAIARVLEHIRAE